MLTLSFPQQSLKGNISLPSSKSESNRALIIQHLSEAQIDLQNLSEARDTQTMIRLLESEGQVLDVIDAGTTMRFLTAFCAATGRDQILTGTPRMCQRPIGLLVDALRSLGADIEYWKQEGFPPLHVISKKSRMKGGKIAMAGNVSSQFISAVLMIAPVLKGGLSLHLEGNISSRPYIDMTLGLMRHFRAASHWDGNVIKVEEKPYMGGSYKIESDWSAASYWYSMMALAKEGEVVLEGLRKESYQGDQAIVQLAEKFGVLTHYTEEGVKLSKSDLLQLPEKWEIDCSAFPDLAQTLAVMAAAKGIPLKLTGLHTLRIKETDRIRALENELAKLGAITESGEDSLHILGKVTKSALIDTYEDHRMAMAFAPLAQHLPSISIKDPEVVNKSYPSFWNHLEKVGFDFLGK